jgi:TonB-linked SusC/RagA family outer membrane protein
MLCVTQVYAQNRTITGTVIAKEDGLPIPGVTIKVKGTTIGAQTGANGKFSLSVPASGTLVVTFIGYQSQEIALGSNSNYNVTLTAASRELGEVSVVAAGGLVTKQRAQGYATTRVDSTTLTAGKATNAAIGLTGKVAGLQINAVSSGVNPNVRVVLRGNRSLTGNNQALIVVDNVIVPNTILSTINPEDIGDIQVLNGAGAAALYGSAASNGAILITTKKGKKGATRITLGNTTSIEQVSFYPKLQNTFGSGSATNEQIYTAFENQQYGDAFDGSLRPIGKPLQDGSIQTIPYSANRDKYNFWETGVTNQTDLSVSGGSDRSTIYFSGQFVNVKGTTPKDKYKRAAFRVNGTHEFNKKLMLTFNTNYTQNRYDITTVTGSIYDNLLNTPAQIPLLSYKDVVNNPFANPNGYYNEYYDNPYYALNANRQAKSDDYFIGSTELKWKVADWVDLVGRVGITTRNQNYKNSVQKFTYTDYTLGISSSKTNKPGGVTDESFFRNDLYSDIYATFHKNITDFTFSLTVGANITNNSEKEIMTVANGLVIPGVYNIANRIGEPGTPVDNNYLRRTHTQALYGDLKVGYKEYLFLEVTGRNDWTSLLAPKNRSFFYPSATISFLPTQAFEGLKDIEAIDQIKLRGNIYKVGNVNVNPYALNPTFGPTSGFPFGSLPGNSAGNRTVALDLRPEITKGIEAGIDFTLFKSGIDASFTYYKTNTTDQTVPVGVSTASGFSSYLRNTGEVQNQGVEAVLHFTPYQTKDWTVTVGGNFTYNDNKVVDISDDQQRLQLSTGTNAQIYAVKGGSSTTIIGTDYVRDNQGRIIVDAVTGYPSVDPTIKILGSTTPKQRLGLDFMVRYKGFRLSGLFEYRGQYSIYHNEGGTFDFSGAGYRTTLYNRERFVIPNSSYADPANPGQYIPNNNITVRDGGAEFWTSSSYNMGVASNYVTSGNYWKLRETSLAYDFPRTMFLNNKYIKGARVSVQGRNLFIWTPKSNIYTDPDYNFTDGNAVGITTLDQAPPTRYFGATVQLTF